MFHLPEKLREFAYQKIIPFWIFFVIIVVVVVVAAVRFNDVFSLIAQTVSVYIRIYMYTTKKCTRDKTSKDFFFRFYAFPSHSIFI